MPQVIEQSLFLFFFRSHMKVIWVSKKLTPPHQAEILPPLQQRAPYPPPHTRMGKGGGKWGGFPPLRVKNPLPTLRPKIGYLQRKFFILPPLWGKKSGIFDKVLLKKCSNGAKKAQNFLCGP